MSINKELVKDINNKELVKDINNKKLVKNINNKELNKKSDDKRDKIIEFMKITKKFKNVENMPKPTKLHISTRSAKSKFSSILDSSYFFELFIIIAKNILKNIVNKKNENYLIKGICMSSYRLETVEKKLKRTKSNITKNNINEIIDDLKKNPRGHFYNQCSFTINPSKYRRPVSIKLFKNGSMSMTGCEYEQDGLDAVKVLLKELQKYPKIFIDDEVVIDSYSITMINSDFKLNYKLKRYELHDKIMSTGLLSNYDPENYPGVKVHYFWNNYNGKKNKGICLCTKNCNGKGDGTGDGKCKKVTVIYFSSGSVIITGANSEIQIKDVYKRTQKYIKKFYSEIINFSITDFLKNYNNYKKIYNF